MYPCASSAFPNAEDAYAGVAYLEAIFLPALPVPYFPRSVSCSPVPISLHAKIGRVILRGVPACVMPRRSFSTIVVMIAVGEAIFEPLRSRRSFWAFNHVGIIHVDSMVVFVDV